MRNAKMDMTVEELVQTHLTAKSSRSVDNLRLGARPLLAFFGAFTLEEICQPYVLPGLCREYAESRKRASGTILKQLGILRAALRWAWKERIIPSLPAMWLPDGTPPRDRVISAEEREALLLAADSFPTRTHVRTHTYLTLFTGQFRYSILGLTWDRVNLVDGVMTFVDEDGEETTVKIDARLFPVLQAARQQKHEKCEHVVQYHGESCTNTFRGMKALLDRAGLSDVTVHDLRKSANGVQVEAPKASPPPSDWAPLFISYCSRDANEQAHALVAELEKRGHACWIASRNTNAGMFSGQLVRAIKGSSGVIVLVTPEANASRDVLQEVVHAHNSQKTIVPLILDNTTPGEDLGYYFNARQQIWWQNAGAAAQAIIGKLGRAKAA